MPSDIQSIILRSWVASRRTRCREAHPAAQYVVNVHRVGHRRRKPGRGAREPRYGRHLGRSVRRDDGLALGEVRMGAAPRARKAPAWCRRRGRRRPWPIRPWSGSRRPPRTAWPGPGSHRPGSWPRMAQAPRRQARQRAARPAGRPPPCQPCPPSRRGRVRLRFMGTHGPPPPSCRGLARHRSGSGPRQGAGPRRNGAWPRWPYSHGGRAEASAARCCGAATAMRRSARSR